jgi:branched-chain amino acid transport system permease protein
MLLLDEPAANLGCRKSSASNSCRKSFEPKGIGVLIVEHNMDFIMQHTDHVILANFGRTIAVGPFALDQAGPVAQAAYLGGVA